MKTAGTLILGVGLPILFFVCFAVALQHRGRCPLWVPIIAVVPFVLLTVIGPMVTAGSLAYGLFGMAVAACLLVSAVGIARRWRWRTVPLFVGLIVAAPAMAVTGLTAFFSLFHAR